MHPRSPFNRLLILLSAAFLAAGSGLHAQAFDYTLSDSLIVPGPSDSDIDVRTFQGNSIAISRDGNTVLSGAPRWGRWIAPPNTINPGAGLIWTYKDGSWNHEVLNPSNTSQNAQVGTSVALSALGNVAVLGAPQDSSGRGSILVMTRSAGGTWRQSAKLMPNPPLRNRTCMNQSCQFGYSVAVSGDGNTIIVGSPYANYMDAAHSRARGGVWIFRRGSDSAWSQDAAITSDSIMGRAMLGNSVGLSDSGNTAIIGGFGYNNWAGGAWIYKHEASGDWTKTALLTGSGDTAAGASFGTSVAISGDGMVAAAGAPSEGDSGAAYLFDTGDGKAWTQRTRLVASDALPYAYGSWEPAQGASVALTGQSSGYLLTVGGVNTDTLKTGATWVWKTKTPSSAYDYQSTKLPKGETYQRYQGRRVAISGDGHTVLTSDGRAVTLYVYRSNP